MFDAIKQVITDSIASNGLAGIASPYQREIDAIVADVAAHVSKCGEDAISAAAEKYDVDEDEARALLVEAGLAVEREPEPEVAEATATDDGNESRFARIEETLARLTAIAERAERSGYLR